MKLKLWAFSQISTLVKMNLLVGFVGNKQILTTSLFYDAALI